MDAYPTAPKLPDNSDELILEYAGHGEWIPLPPDFFLPRCECVPVRESDGAITGYRICDVCMERENGRSN